MRKAQKRLTQGLSLNNYVYLAKNEVFSKASVPLGTCFFVRLDGWKSRRLSEAVGAEKPFDEKFVRCLVSSGKLLFKVGFNPALVYAVSDELNILFMSSAPFNGRIEKIDSITSSLVSSAFAIILTESVWQDRDRSL